MTELAAQKDTEITTIKDDRDTIKAELDKFKSDFQRKMAEVKLLEAELEEKLGAVKGDEDDD